MANMLFANNCNTTLNGGITAVATSMVVTSATGFPSPTGSQYFYCTLADAATQTIIEIVKDSAVFSFAHNKCKFTDELLIGVDWSIFAWRSRCDRIHMNNIRSRYYENNCPEVSPN